jgi:hypothetical protein
MPTNNHLPKIISSTIGVGGTSTANEAEDLFDKTLRISSFGLDKILLLLEFACRSLIELAKTFSKILLPLTAGYALLIWRHYPAEEPRILIICWCASLTAANLGEKALDGAKAPTMKYQLALMIVAYLFPVKAFSELLQAF